MEKGHISVQTENIFPIIKQFLYSDQEIFLRELIANAVDATSKLKTLAKRGEVKGDIGDTTIDILIDADKKTLTIRDRGIGMSEEEVKKYLNQVAFSSASEFLEKYKDQSIIGHFGLGFYSAFMVADKVSVQTKSYTDADGVQWECEGDPSYEIGPLPDKTERGTDIILHVSDDADEYLKEERIQELLDKYCKFLPVQIRFGTKTESTWEGEGEDRTEIKTDVDNIINNTDPLWKKSPNDLTDEDYIGFYKELHPFLPDPLFWIHLNIDYPFNLTGVLYFPKLSNNIELQRNKIALYSNQVYVTDNVEAIVPEFLTLLHGVIDSPDIPLNVSRSYLQSDRNVKKITGYITKKVADKLSELFKSDRKAYESKWDEISIFVKYGLLSDEKFYEKSIKNLLFKNTAGEYFTTDEFKEKVQANQTDKNDKVVHIYTHNPEVHHSYITGATDRGYDVLVKDQVIDNHLMQQLEMKLENVSFKRVDADTPDLLVEKDEERESVLSEKELEKVKTLFTEHIDLPEYQLKFKPLSPQEHPVVITRPEFMRRMAEMQTSMNAGMGEMPEHFEAIVNTNHPLVAEKLTKLRSQEKKERFVKYLYDLGRLNQNLLKGDELSQFINRSLEFVE